MSRKILIVKGCSGVGKSTRISSLIESLKTHYQQDITPYENFGYTIGCNLIIGGYNKLGKFQGLDGVFKKIGSMVNFSSTLSHLADYYTIIVEGSALSLTYRLRPTYLVGENKFDSSLCTYFLYNSKEEYENRILNRTGKLPKKEAGWNHNKDFEKEYNKYLEELKGVEYTHRVVYSKFDEPEENFVLNSLNFLNSK